MQKQADWRHLLLAAIVTVGILMVGWKVFMGPPAPPNVPAPAGANPRREDVPDYAPAASVDARKDAARLRSAGQ